MNPIATVVVSVLLASAAATAVVITLRPADAPADATRLTDLQRTVGELQAQNGELLRKLDALAKAPVAEASPAASRTEAASVSAEQVAAAVEAYLQKRGSGGVALAASAGKSADAAATFDVDTELASLSGVYFDENQALWRRLYASGKAKEVLDRLEAAVKANPKDVKAQMDLATAHLSVMRLEPEEYSHAMRADKAFDEVLALDDKHWEARFTKAVSYSFWPPITGKPKQAVAHLEKLVAQQDTMPPQAHEAQTYLILGNLLESSGDSARAREMWSKGARRHPDSQELAQRLRN